MMELPKPEDYAQEVIQLTVQDIDVIFDRLKHKENWEYLFEVAGTFYDNPSRIYFDGYNESDDEGGSYFAISDVTVTGSNRADLDFIVPKLDQIEQWILSKEYQFSYYGENFLDFWRAYEAEVENYTEEGDEPPTVFKSDAYEELLESDWFHEWHTDIFRQMPYSLDESQSFYRDKVPASLSLYMLKSEYDTLS